MTITAYPSIRRYNERRDETNVSTETLLRDASMLLMACGVTRSGAWLNRTVREFTSSTAIVPFGLFLITRLDLNRAQRNALAERADLRYLLDYQDPTGETAARNVDRERNR